MKKKQKQYIWALIMIGALIAYFATGCNSTRRISSSQTTAEQTTTDNQTQQEQERTVTMTDTTRTDTGTTQRIIIEFRDPPPGESPPDPPPDNADQNYYNYMLYLHLINQIKSIEQITNQNTITRAGLDITDTTRESVQQSQKKTTQASETSESSNSEPIAITPAWVKSVRTIGLIILFIAVALLFIRYGGAIRRIFKR